MSALRPRVADSGGYSLVELVSVLAILGIILGAISVVFVRATGAEVESNNRFQAQENGLVALARLRKDVHCATSLSPSGAASAIAISEPTACAASGFLSWCTVANGSRYDLYRAAGSTCNSSVGVKIAEKLTSSAPFSYSAPVAGSSLGILHVDLTLRAGAAASGAYELRDDIVLRNTSRQ
jgi:prepilin-type N-terminal cleavage/methylation domain-containing protein